MKSIRDIVPPVTTSFDLEGYVDLDALWADLHYLVNAARVQGLAVCGSTGEGHTLTTDEIRQITGTAVKAVAGRVLVLR